MQKEDKIKIYIQDSFREIHAPAELRRKVMNMSGQKEKKSFAWAKKLAVAAAIALTVFAGSNCVAYAMTGSTWVEGLRAIIRVDGVEQEVDLDVEVLEDGTVVHKATFESPEGNPGQIVVESFQEDGEVPELLVIEMDSDLPEGMRIEPEEDRVYLKDSGVVIDITEDLADGQADVSYEKDGNVYRYVIEESPYVAGSYDYYLVEE